MKSFCFRAFAAQTILVTVCFGQLVREPELERAYQNVSGRSRDLEATLATYQSRASANAIDSAIRGVIDNVSWWQGRRIAQIQNELAAIRREQGLGFAAMRNSNTTEASRVLVSVRARISRVEALFAQYREGTGGAAAFSGIVGGVAACGVAFSGPIGTSVLGHLAGVGAIASALPEDVSTAEIVNPNREAGLADHGQSPRVIPPSVVGTGNSGQESHPESPFYATNSRCNGDSSSPGHTGESACRLSGRERRRLEREAQSYLRARERSRLRNAEQVVRSAVRENLVRQNLVQQNSVQQNPAQQSHDPTGASGRLSLRGPRGASGGAAVGGATGPLPTADDVTLGQSISGARPLPAEAFVDASSRPIQPSNSNEIFTGAGRGQIPREDQERNESAGLAQATPVHVRSIGELIAEAQNALRTWRGEGRAPLDLALFQLEVEAAQLRPALEQDEYDFLVEGWRDAQTRYQEILRSQNSIGAVADQVIRDYLTIYARDSASTLEALRGTGSNCVGRNQLFIAALTRLNRTPNPDEQIGVQVFSDHVQAVVYNAQSHIVTDLMTGERLDHVLGPIYRPAFLLNAFLRAQNANSPVQDGELLIARADLIARSPGGQSPFGETETNESRVARRSLEFHVSEPTGAFATGAVPAQQIDGVPQRDRSVSGRTGPISLTNLGSGRADGGGSGGANANAEGLDFGPAGSPSQGNGNRLFSQEVIRRRVPGLIEAIRNGLRDRILARHRNLPPSDPRYLSPQEFSLFEQAVQHMPPFWPISLPAWQNYFIGLNELILRLQMPRQRRAMRWFSNPSGVLPELLRSQRVDLPIAEYQWESELSGFAEILNHTRPYCCPQSENVPELCCIELLQFAINRYGRDQNDRHYTTLYFNNDGFSRWLWPDPRFSFFPRSAQGPQARLFDQSRAQLANAYRQTFVTNPAEALRVLAAQSERDQHDIIAQILAPSRETMDRLAEILTHPELVSDRPVRLSRGELETLMRRVEERRAVEARQGQRPVPQVPFPVVEVEVEGAMTPLRLEPRVEGQSEQASRRERPPQTASGRDEITRLAQDRDLASIIGRRPVVLSGAVQSLIRRNQMLAHLRDRQWTPGTLPQSEYARLCSEPLAQDLFRRSLTQTRDFSPQGNLSLSENATNLGTYPREVLEFFYDCELRRLRERAQREPLSQQGANFFRHLQIIGRALGRDHLNDYYSRPH